MLWDVFQCTKLNVFEVQSFEESVLSARQRRETKAEPGGVRASKEKGHSLCPQDLARHEVALLFGNAVHKLPGLPASTPKCFRIVLLDPKEASLSTTKMCLCEQLVGDSAHDVDLLGRGLDDVAGLGVLGETLEDALALCVAKNIHRQGQEMGEFCSFRYAAAFPGSRICNGMCIRHVKLPRRESPVTTCFHGSCLPTALGYAHHDKSPSAMAC